MRHIARTKLAGDIYVDVLGFKIHYNVYALMTVVFRNIPPPATEVASECGAYMCKISLNFHILLALLSVQMLHRHAKQQVELLPHFYCHDHGLVMSRWTSSRHQHAPRT
jgi:hypothetical protein